MNTANLGFYIAPNDPALAQRLLWLRDRGVGHIGFDGFRRDDEQTYASIRRAIAASGLNLLVVHGEPPLVAPDGDDKALRAAHRRVLGRAQALGAQLVVLHYRLVTDPQADMADHDRRMTDLLRWLSAEAEAIGVSIAVENLPLQHTFGYRVEELVRYVASLELPNVRFCLDSGHAHLSGLDVAQAVRQGGKWLLTTHFHDNLGLADPRDPIACVDRHLAPGLGTINWPEVILALRDIHFPGPIMFEGVRTIPHGPLPDFELAGDLTLRNWQQFEKIACTMAKARDCRE